MQYYKLIKEDIKKIQGYTLYRIRATKSFGDMRKGDLGGYIDESSKLLNYAWIYSGYVYNNSRIENSRIENSTVENSLVENSLVENSIIENNAVVENISTVENSIVNNSTIFHSKVKNSSVLYYSGVYNNIVYNIYIKDNIWLAKAWKVFYVSDMIKCVKYDKRTRIYINNKKFIQCSYLLISVPKIDANRNYESIDEIAELYKHDHEKDKMIIDDDTEFMGHCSNLQAWYENDYDTRILHSNLSFPLLKKLAEIGDIKAKKVFKEEIAKRWNSGYKNVQKYLKKEGYLDFLTIEELQILDHYEKRKLE